MIALFAVRFRQTASGGSVVQTVVQYATAPAFLFRSASLDFAFVPRCSDGWTRTKDASRYCQEFFVQPDRRERIVIVGDHIIDAQRVGFPLLTAVVRGIIRWMTLWP